MTTKHLRDLTPDDYGRAVSLPRPASYQSGKRAFVGKLISVTKRSNSMGRAEYLILLEYGGPSYSRDREVHGPLPGDFPIDVRHLWHTREPGTTVIGLKVDRPPQSPRRPNPFIPPHQ